MTEGLTPEERVEFVGTGLKFMMMLAGGPKRWEKLPKTIKPELIGSYMELMARDTSGASADSCMIQNVHTIVMRVVTLLTDEMAAWAAANGRQDLLAPLSARVEDSIMAAGDDD